jgi:hypothetical protein
VCLIRGRRAWFLVPSHVVLCAHGRRVGYSRVSLRIGRVRSGDTYAARFCALRLLWAGVRLSFSSLLLRFLPWPSSRSAPIPESMLPTGIGVCAAMSSGEPCCGVDKPLVNPKASYEVEKRIGSRGSCEACQISQGRVDLRGLQTSRTPADGILTTLRIVSRSTPVCGNEFMPMKWL